ncbi:hypothetical protein E2C01_059637 [Portunus trituberculatus]|uniref:Uncharacterized protein n=1 Tax=Portunus trituberculatus TaxID=210409 RepID=A0A5B7H346_PORTR|nr:hypothetical protein [Portunus trituberculatus]
MWIGGCGWEMVDSDDRLEDDDDDEEEEEEEKEEEKEEEEEKDYIGRINIRKVVLYNNDVW